MTDQKYLDISFLHKRQREMELENSEAQPSQCCDLLNGATPMTDYDKETIRLLDNLSANIKAGYITTVRRDGDVLGDDKAELRLVFSGEPRVDIAI